MSVINWPADLPVRTQDFGIKHFALDFSNADTGGGQVAVLGPRRLTCAMTSEPDVSPERAAKWQAVLFALDGRVNQLAVWNVLRPAPRGTLRGQLVADQAAPAGANTLQIRAPAAQAGHTLLAGDWIGVQQASTGEARQLLHVQADTAADGNGLLVVQVGVPLRAALPAGGQIVWDRPTCLMRQTTTENKWTAQGSRTSGYSLDLMERWE